MNSKELTDELIRLFTRIQKINLFRNIASNLTQAETDVLMLLYFHQLDFNGPLKGLATFSKSNLPQRFNLSIRWRNMDM